MIDNYSRLLEVAAELGNKEVSDAAVTKLIVHLNSVGRIMMLPKIARELRKISAKRHFRLPCVEVSCEEESTDAIGAAEQEGIVVQSIIVNPDLIRGWRAQKNGILIDRSAKQSLLHMYHKITE